MDFLAIMTDGFLQSGGGYKASYIVSWGFLDTAQEFVATNRGAKWLLSWLLRGRKK